MNLFISYSRADRAFAEQLRSRIETLGANVWSDESKIEPGENWDQALRRALEASDGVVLVVPERGAPKANAAFFEAGAARALGKPVVAVIPDAEPSRVGGFSDVYGPDVFDGARVPPESLAEKIVITYWRRIYNANKSMIGSDPNLIKPGEELVIPFPSKLPTHYIVKEGDTLSGIALRFYGNGTESWCRKIYDANKTVIGANSNLIKPGQDLTIPVP